MAQNVDTQKILDNTAKTYTITKDSTAGEIFEAAQAFVMDHAHINAGAADSKALQQYQQFVLTLRGVTPEAERDMKQQIVNPSETRVNNDDNDKLDQYFDNNSDGVTKEISLKIGGLNTSWTYNWKKFEFHDFDQIGAAQRLADACKGHVAYDIDRDKYRAWNGRRWVWIDAGLNQLTQLTTEILQNMIDEASLVYADDSSDGFKAAKHDIKQLMTQPKMLQILKLAQTENMLGVSNVRYNYPNFLINAQNGEIDLKTGELLPHNKDHMFTKIIPYNYNPEAQSDVLKYFLDVTFQHDDDLIKYMQIALGDSALSGENTDRHMYVISGKGHDGKSVLMSAVRNALGGNSQDDSGFADTASIKTFLKNGNKSGSSASPDLAALDGVRFVTPSEPDKHDELDEGLVKSLTGKSDAMKVRALYSRPVTLYPQFSIWIAANDIPKSSASQAIMDRLVIAPFEHRIIPGTAEDQPDIADRLEETKNAEAVLAWLVKGSVMANNHRKAAAQEAQKARENGNFNKIIYQDPLMPYPDVVTRARQKYQYGANSALSFIFDTLYSQDQMLNIVIESMLSNDETCISFLNGISNHPTSQDNDIYHVVFNELRLVFDKSAYVTKTDLYNLYKIWCNSEGIDHPMAKRTFGDAMSKILMDGKQRGQRVWLGVGVMPWFERSNGYFSNILHLGNYAGRLKVLAHMYSVTQMLTLKNNKDKQLFIADDGTNITSTDTQNSIDDFVNANPASYAQKYNTNRNNVKWPDVQPTNNTNTTQNNSTNNTSTNQQSKSDAIDVLNDEKASQEEQNKALNELFDD